MAYEISAADLGDISHFDDAFKGNLDEFSFLGEDVDKFQDPYDSEDSKVNVDNLLRQDQGSDPRMQHLDDIFLIDNLPPTKQEDYDQGPVTKRARSAFGRSIKAARGSAFRNDDEADTLILREASGSFPPAPSRTADAFGRQNRVKGSTLPAYARKVTHELDSDDELTMNMRDKGYSDLQIADKLKNDGRSVYNQKSIATRICRIRHAQAKHQDFLLKEGYKEWQLEDDQLLMRAYDLADIDIRYEMERLRAWRFRKVAEYMRRLNKDALFSANACRDRYLALIQGTAMIPTEVDDDPDARRLEMETYRREREATRASEQRVKHEREIEEQRVKEEVRSRNAKKAAETAATRNRVAQEKAARAIARAAKASIYAQKSAENDRKKADRHESLEAKRLAEQAAKADKERKRKKLKALSLSAVKDVTENTPDPRAGLSFIDLHKLCMKRKLAVGTGSKADLIKCLRNADKKLTATELRERCKTKGVGLGGSKIQMRHQLAIATAMDCPSYRGPGAGVTKGDD